MRYTIGPAALISSTRFDSTDADTSTIAVHLIYPASNDTHVNTVDEVVALHPRATTLRIVIYEHSLQSLQTLVDLVARLPSLSAVDMYVACELVNPAITFTVPATIRTLRYHLTDPSNLHIVRQFSQHATHVATKLSHLVWDPAPDWLPSVTFLSVAVSHTTACHLKSLSGIIAHFPLLTGLAICQSGNVPKCAFNLIHPNIKYLRTNMRPYPILHLPYPLLNAYPPVHFRSSTSYLSSRVDSDGIALGHRLASFLLSAHRRFPNTDPLILTSIFTHLTNRDGVHGPETSIYTMKY